MCGFVSRWMHILNDGKSTVDMVRRQLYVGCGYVGVVVAYHLAWFIIAVPTTRDCQYDEDIAISSPLNSNHTWNSV